MLFFDVIVDNSHAKGYNDSGDDTASLLEPMGPAILNYTEDYQHKNGEAQDYQYDVLEDITDYLTDRAYLSLILFVCAVPELKEIWLILSNPNAA